MPTVSTPSSHSLVDLRLVVDQVGGEVGGSRDVDESVRVGRVPRPDHEQEVDLGQHVLDGPLPVGRRVADVLFLRTDDLRETTPERRDDLTRLVHGEGGLRDVGEPRVGRQLERLGLPDVLDEDRRVGRLAHRPDDLLVAGVPDQEDGVAAGRVPLRLHVDLRDEWARRVDHIVLQQPGVLVHGRGDPMRRVDNRCAARNVALVLDEDRAPRFEVAHDVDVVDDLLPHVYRGAVVVEGAFHRLHGTLDPGAVAAGRGEEDALDAHGSRVLGAVRPLAVAARVAPT